MSKASYRVGMRVGQTRWQIKEAPGWRVVHQCDQLYEAVEWFQERGVDLAAVPVLIGHPWPTLASLMPLEDA